MNVLQSAKAFVLEATDLSKDALHIYVGLGVMLLVVIAFRKPMSDWRPLAAAGLAAVAGELWSVFDTFMHGGAPKWSGDWKGIWNTMFWPTILFGLARFTRVLKR
jgi:hypothetical protein